MASTCYFYCIIRRVSLSLYTKLLWLALVTSIALFWLALVTSIALFWLALVTSIWPQGVCNLKTRVVVRWEP
jgi:hypothetical protein